MIDGAEMEDWRSSGRRAHRQLARQPRPCLLADAPAYLGIPSATRRKLGERTQHFTKELVIDDKTDISWPSHLLLHPCVHRPCVTRQTNSLVQTLFDPTTSDRLASQRPLTPLRLPSRVEWSERASNTASPLTMSAFLQPRNGRCASNRLFSTEPVPLLRRPRCAR